MMNSIEHLIPEPYRVWFAIAVLCIPYVTRSYHALVSGGGLRGIWRGVMFGTNQPKEPVPTDSQPPANPMKPFTTFTTLLTLAALLFTSSARAQTNPLPAQPTPAGVLQSVDQAFAHLDTNVNLFAAQEVELATGGIYSQSTGEGGIALRVTDWGRFVDHLGVGLETIQGSDQQSPATLASFGFLEYRKPIGNIAGSIFAGGGYDQLNSKPMGVIGARLCYRTTAHVGIWCSVGLAIEPSSKDRGLIAGAGLSYSF